MGHPPYCRTRQAWSWSIHAVLLCTSSLSPGVDRWERVRAIRRCCENMVTELTCIGKIHLRIVSPRGPLWKSSSTPSPHFNIIIVCLPFSHLAVLGAIACISIPSLCWNKSWRNICVRQESNILISYFRNKFDKNNNRRRKSKTKIEETQRRF